MKPKKLKQFLIDDAKCSPRVAEPEAIEALVARLGEQFKIHPATVKRMAIGAQKREIENDEDEGYHD